MKQIIKGTVQETLIIPLYARKMCSERFPEGRFVFDAVNELGFKMMMKLVLKNWDMQEAKSYFRTNNPVAELSAWSERIKVSNRGYMLGYYDMKNPEVKGIYRLMAKIADKWLGMNIIKIEL